MKKILFISFSCCILFSLIAKAQRIETLLEKNWKFTKGEVAEAMKPEFDDRKRETVTVPHDWAIFRRLSIRWDGLRMRHSRWMRFTWRMPTVPSMRTRRVVFLFMGVTGALVQKSTCTRRCPVIQPIRNLLPRITSTHFRMLLQVNLPNS